MTGPLRRRARTLGITVLLTLAVAGSAGAAEPVGVGSKSFTEGHVLAEIVAQLLEDGGVQVQRKPGLGGTLIAFEALREGSIDVYPEYTGTIAQTLLNMPQMPESELPPRLAERGLQMIVALGFNNSYAIAMSRPAALALGIETIGDLAAHPSLRAAFSHEFLERVDGWPALRAAYGLPHQAVGIEHALAYDAIENGALDITDAYTTDGELAARNLLLLRDDRNFFPRYSAVLLARADLRAEIAAMLAPLEQAIDETRMRQLNQQVMDGGLSPAAVATGFLREAGLVSGEARAGESRARRILSNTAVHLQLTGTALLLACIVAIPLALVASRFQRFARGLLYVTGLVQTIPALALLALLIPVFGLGQVPAEIALFLYSLLPIVRNTLSGLFTIDPLIPKVARGLGYSSRQRLWHVELPLAMPTLLAGIKTAAIISIGTATLAAFVGAGGLGEPIITGLTLNDHRLILEGAIPAALLAIVVELLFEAVERALIPAHLRS